EQDKGQGSHHHPERGVIELVAVERHEREHRERGKWGKADVPLVRGKPRSLAANLLALDFSHAGPVFEIWQNFWIQIQSPIEPRARLINEVRGSTLPQEAKGAERGKQKEAACENRQLDLMRRHPPSHQLRRESARPGRCGGLFACVLAAQRSSPSVKATAAG